MGNGERGTGDAGFLGQLVERWAEEGIRPAGGVGEDEVLAFERRCGVKLPWGLRAYFREVGGILADGESPALDRDLIRFWPLSEVSSLARAWVPAPEAERWFVIADYAMWTWAYVVRLPPEPATVAPVAVSLGGAELRPVADTFEKFVEMYFSRDPLVITPDQEPTRG